MLKKQPSVKKEKSAAQKKTTAANTKNSAGKSSKKTTSNPLSKQGILHSKDTVENSKGASSSKTTSAQHILKIKKLEEELKLAKQELQARSESIDSKKLGESNKRYNMILMQSPFAFSLMKGKDMVITLANDLMKEFWGKGKKVEGKPLLQILPELKDQPFPGMIDSVYTSGKTVYANEMLARLNHDGVIEDRYFNIIYQPHLEADETISGVITIAHEVTDQVLSRKKIEESEHRYHELVNSSPSLICICKGENMIVEIANDAILESWGKGNIRGQSLFVGLPETVEQGFDKHIMGVYKTGVPFQAYEVPVTLLRKGIKEIVYYNYIYQAQHNVNGEIEGVAIIATEVTPQAESNLKTKAKEEQFRLLVEQAPVAICVLRGENYVIEIINERMFEWWDRTMEQTLNKPVFDVLTELKEQGFKELLDNVYHTGKRFVAEELPISLKRKGKLESGYVKFVYEPLREADGTVSGVMALAHDITDQVLARKNMEETVIERTSELQHANLALNQKYHELESMNKELEAFTFVSSHDLQEPLRKIRNFISLLEVEKTKLSEEGKDYLKGTRDTANRMQVLIEDLLAYSRLKKTDLVFEKITLNEIAKETIADFTDTIDKKKAVVKVDAPCEVSIIRFQFRQLLHNLISNSLKFSQSGKSPQITIKSETVRGSELHDNAGLLAGKLLPNKNYCHITLTDNGIGFDPQYKDRIFEVFQRLHEFHEYKGTGIGLAICKRIVENHNGFITATGELNKGARFDIYLIGHD